ncbi:MAG: hypothetical protein DDT18_01354 [Actinobacteria bacterium]|nr:hypothetical protein [Actinomycetota bacterium]
MGHGRGAYPDSAGDGAAPGIIGDSVLVHHDSHSAQSVLSLPAGNAVVGQIHQKEMGICAAGDNSEPSIAKGLGQSSGIVHNSFLIFLKFIRKSNSKTDGLGGDDMHEGATLNARKDAFVNGLGKLSSTEDKSSPRAAKSLVGGGGGKMDMGNGRGIYSCCYQTGEVGHVSHKQSAYFIGNLPKESKIDDPGVSAGAADD